MPHNAMHVLIVDDEHLARQRLIDLLEDRDEIAKVDTAEHGEEAIDYLDTTSPDLVFLDVQMPGETGLDVVREVGVDNMPLTIFVTAYDEYAVQAFDLAALDYLLKPFDDERFEQAFERAKDVLERENTNELQDQLRSLLEQQGIKETDGKANPETLDRIAVESRGETLILPVTDIRYISASGPYLEIHTDEDTYLLRERMKTIDNNLDDRFFRIHRSTIVQLDQIEALVNESAGSYTVKLANGETLPVSRRRRSELEDILGLNL